MTRTFFLALFFAGLVLSRPVAAEERHALIIGNSKYEGQPALRNPANDADAIEATLKKLDFKVTKKIDLEQKKDFEKALVDFHKTLKKGSVALFFYAGHGIQVKGENFLLPIKAGPGAEFEVAEKCYKIDQVLAAMDDSQSTLKVVILDCCRDNPFTRGWKRSVSGDEKGMAAISKIAEGTIIAFATAPGLTAADGKGANSPYTTHLVASFNSRPKEGLELVDALREASRAVKKETGQVPWLNLEGSIDKYYLWRDVASASKTPAKTADKPAPEVISNSLDMKLVLIPAGEFMMGSEERDADARKDELPRHKVRITKSFYMGQHEVTLGQFLKFYHAEKYKIQIERDFGDTWWGFDKEGNRVLSNKYRPWDPIAWMIGMDHPAIFVSWNDAKAFCDWLSKTERKKYRLPTEAEWEYACRAGTSTRHHFGDDPEQLVRFANVADRELKSVLGMKTPSNWIFVSGSDGYAWTAPVGKFRPNAFGLYDMHGNACEWCSDWYTKDYYEKSPVDDPQGPAAGSLRVIRGGAFFFFFLRNEKCAYRDFSPELWATYPTGFRVVCEH